MSTLAYSAITARREAATPGTSTDANAVDAANDEAGKPGVGLWLDTAAALVPAEVLAAHAFLIQTVTDTAKDASGQTRVTITNAHDAQVLFWVLLGVPLVLYVLGHVSNWDRWDYVRMLIPSAAFVLWSALQSGTAFDAVANWSEFVRALSGVVGVILLAAVARTLAFKADQKTA